MGNEEGRRRWGRTGSNDMILFHHPLSLRAALHKVLLYFVYWLEFFC